MTKEIGRPPPVPGSEGIAKTKACRPATLLRLRLDFLLHLGLAAAALAPRLQHPGGEAGIGRAGAGDGEARRRPRGCPWCVWSISFDEERGVVDGRILRPGDQREQRALVLFRRQLGRGVSEQVAGGGDEHGTIRSVIGRRCSDPSSRRSIPVGDRIEDAIDDMGEAAAGRCVSMPRRHHRRDGQRDDARNGDGAGQSERELAEQRAGDAGGEGDRREHGGERDRHGDHAPR